MEHFQPAREVVQELSMPPGEVVANHGKWDDWHRNLNTEFQPSGGELVTYSASTGTEALSFFFFLVLTSI